MSKSDLIFFLAGVALLQVIGGLIMTAPTEAANNCSVIVCYNGGTCNNYSTSPPCICPLPYIAPYCQAAADYCLTLQPDKGINERPVCQNGGTCTMIFTDPYFNCTCPFGYTGWRCNQLIITLDASATFNTNWMLSTQKQSSGFSTRGVAGITFGSAVAAAAILLVGMGTTF